MNLNLFLPLLLLQVSATVGKVLPHIDECTPLNIDPAQCEAYWGDQKPPLLIISADGFRADYLSRRVNGEPSAPTLNLLAQCGVWASSGMMPTYPTKTFPNHYSIITGLYPESHGIVENSFYDPDLNASFTIFSSQQTNSVWWTGDPLWYTAKIQDKITAAYFWPGSYITDPRREPTYWVDYDENIPFAARVEHVFGWLKLPISQRPNFLNLYFYEPDHTAHAVSPDSELMDDVIRDVDNQVKYLLDLMEKEGILGCVDLMVVADHGMANTPVDEQFVRLEDLVPNIKEDARIYEGTVPTIRPNQDTEEEQDRIASGLECKNENMRVYNKWEFPRRHHYSNNNRIPSLLLDMSVGWRAYGTSGNANMGNHGWNGLNSEMQAVFLAQGPSFKKNVQVPPFYNIELYNLMCAMIDVTPAPNNGTWGALHHFLISPPADPPAPPVLPQYTLPYPVDSTTYDEHLQRKKCNLITGSNDLSIDDLLNLNQAAMDRALLLHTPWGSPQYEKESSNVKIVISTDYVSGFNLETGLPVWTSYTLRQPEELSNSNLSWRLDVRLEKDSPSICDQDIDTASSTLVPIFPFGKGATETDMAVDTNAIEVSTNFLNLWTEFHTKLSKSVAFNGETNIVVGPIRDSSSPSLFFIVSNCHNNILSECSIDRLDVQTFILPTHLKYNQGCTSSNEFFNQHLAGLRDVVQITGLNFFPTTTYRDQVDLVTRTPFASMLLVNPDPIP